MRRLLRGGTVVGGDRVEVGDVLIDDGIVVAVGQNLADAAPDAEVVDCTGAWVGPGFVDLHVHLREPGQEWKEDIATGSAAAAAGGFTTVVAMPNTDPPIDSGHMARYISDRGREAGLVDVKPAGCLTEARAGRKLSHFDDLRAAGVSVFTDDGDTVADAGLLRRAMEYIADLGGIVAQHAEDPGLAAGGHMHEGRVSSALGIAGLPSLAEEVIVARDLRLVELTGCRYHVQHVSTTGTVELVAAAKEAGLPVTAEVAPHHLSLDHDAVRGMDSVMKMYPPLRTHDDVAALRDALVSGVIDCVATDHAPHSAHEKDVPFEEAPRGIIGLETAAAVVNGELGLEPHILFDRMSLGPRRILGLPIEGLVAGARADIVVFAPGETWRATGFRSKSSNTPWMGAELKGRVKMTLYGGEVTFEDTPWR